ncbi:MAG: ATP-binding protein [Deltaproteobacteria bacterium]
MPQCREHAIKIVNGKAYVVAELCDRAGACIGRCPQGAISFKEEGGEKQACGCPGAATKTFTKGKTSGLTTWPVQLRLIPPGAPFLENAELLVAADCVPCAYPGFHQDLLSEAIAESGKKIPFHDIEITVRGEKR